MNNLAGFCIYTVRDSTELHEQVTKGAPHILTEGRAWVTGQRLWDQARQSGAVMPLVFAGAEDETGLIFWAVIDDIAIDERTRTTACTYSDLKPITPARPITSLRLRATGRPISADFIRPYAICHTPAFLG